MGVIKDIIDLTKDLESRVKTRQDMDLIHRIQMLAFSLQSQQAEVVERDIRILQENADLKRQLAESQVEEICIHKGIEFRRGKRTRDKWLGFCPKCHMPAQDGWRPIKYSDNKQQVVFCSANCGWEVFMKSLLEDIAKEISQ